MGPTAQKLMEPDTIWGPDGLIESPVRPIDEGKWD
jgi:hypothetical protein